jgi:hypothetical protein
MDRLAQAYIRYVRSSTFTKAFGEALTAFSGDAHIYTITSNSVLRIYSPVLDDPSWFQLLSSMDSRSFAKPRGSAKGKVAATSAGTLWVLDADHLRSGLAAQIFRVEESGERVPAESMKIMEALAAEESDVVAWLGSDGVLSLRSIVVRPIVSCYSTLTRVSEHGQKAAHPPQIAPSRKLAFCRNTSTVSTLDFRKSTAPHPYVVSLARGLSPYSGNADDLRDANFIDRPVILPAHRTDTFSRGDQWGHHEARADDSSD